MLSLTDLRWRRCLRFTLGITLGFVFSQLFAWPASYLMVVLLTMLLVSPGIDLRKAAGFLLVILAGGLLGLLLTMSVVNYPAACLLIVTLLMFQIFYAANRGLSPLLVLMLIVGVTAIPLLGLLEPELSSGVVGSLLTSGFFAVLIALLMFALFPEPPASAATDTPKVERSLSPYRGAVVSTIVMVPLVIVFYTFELTGALVVFIFAANLAQNPDLGVGIKSSAALLIANAAGGVIAVVLYTFVMIAPSMAFIALLVALLALQFSRRIYSDDPRAQLYQTAFTTVLLLLGNSLGDFSGDAAEVFFSRITQIMAAGLYIVAALYLLQLLFRARKRAGVSAGPETSLVTDFA